MADSPPLKHLYLIDGSGFIFRAFHALPPMTRADGTPVNAVYGFTQMLMKLLADSDADHLAVVFDAGRRSFRNDLYPDYKANRPDPPDDLIPQFALVREATRAFNVPAIELDGFEADDIIATYAEKARKQGARVTIVSSDKDLMQLVGDGVDMLDPLKNRPIGLEEVAAKFGVAPDKVVDVQALAGDSSDNVPGVPGIGVKTAAQLIADYGDLDTLLARAHEIKQPKRRQALLDHADHARLSRDLVRLRRDAPVDPDDPAVFAARTPDPKVLIPFLEEQRFKSILARVQAVFDAEARNRAGAGAPPKEVAYELVRDKDALKRWVREAQDLGVVGLDTETDSLNALRARLVGVSLATRPGRACYIPLRHVAPGGDQGALDLDDKTSGESRNDGSAPRQIPLKDALAVLKPLLEDEGVLKVGHNIKYDMEVLAGEGVRVAPVDDTMVLSYVLDGGLHGHGLDELAERHFGHTTISFKDVCGSGRDKITFDRVDLEAALDYAAEDADFALRLHELFRPRLLAERMVSVHEDLDRPLIPVLVVMEQAGIAVDAPRLKELSAEFALAMGRLESEIHALAGETFNVGSPKQLGEILFERMGLDGGKKSAKSGAWSTGADVLEQLAAQGHELPAKVLEWRQVAKLKSTYTDALTAQVHPATGRVHTNFSQTVANTGRLSSNDPNLQNIPVRTEAGRKIREAFVAAPGHLLMSADYSQIELRLTAHIADVPALKQAFREGRDIHAITAAEVFGVPLEGMDPMVRRRAKAINFGIIYGISPFGLAAQLGIEQGEAKAYIDNYFKRFPEIRGYMDRTREQARNHGFVTTLMGRKCHTPGIRDKNPAMRSFAERAAINAPIQGTAADVIKRAMIRIPPALEQAGLAAKMLLQVHDELVFEVPEAEVDATSRLVREVMEGVVSLSVPLVVDTGQGATWAEAH